MASCHFSGSAERRRTREQDLSDQLRELEEETTARNRLMGEDESEAEDETAVAESAGEDELGQKAGEVEEETEETATSDR